MPSAPSFHEDYNKDEYKGVGVVTEDVGDAISDFGLGHYLDPDKVFARIEYAYRSAKKTLGNNYILLVKIVREHGYIGWMTLATHQDIDKTFTLIPET